MEKDKNLSAIPAEEFAACQKALDIDKWLASERAHRDQCGTFPWCAYCVKAEAYPCAKAKFRQEMERALDEISDELITEQEGETPESSQEVVDEIAAEEISECALAAAKEIPDGYEEVTRYRRSFKSRIIQSAPLQDQYTELKNTLLGYAGVKTRICQSGEHFRVGGKRVAKLVVTGKKLSLFLALSPEEFESTNYRFEDVGEKKSHRETPMRVKITGKRAMKQAKELLGILMDRLGLAQVGCIYSDFHYPYRTDEELIRKGLIKPYKTLVKKKAENKK